jgi:hypothetical protein
MFDNDFYGPVKKQLLQKAANLRNVEIQKHDAGKRGQ